MENYKNYDYLYQNNVINHISMTELARECGVSSDTIKYYMNKYGIKPWYKPKDTPKLGKYKEEIINLYISGLSPNEIAKRFSVSRTCVNKILKEMNVKRRTKQEAQFNHNKKDIPNKLFDENWLHTEHIGNRRSVKDMATELNIDPGTLRRQMKRLGIKTRTNSESKLGLMVGNRHPNWQDGKSKLSELLREWFKTNLSRKVAERDNYTCLLCGKTHTVLHIHHIKKFKDIVNEIISEYPEYTITSNKSELYYKVIYDVRFRELTNLITLCKECHKKIHGKHNTISNQDLLSLVNKAQRLSKA